MKSTYEYDIIAEKLMKEIYFKSYSDEYISKIHVNFTTVSTVLSGLALFT